jgi:hypothetical protein
MNEQRILHCHHKRGLKPGISPFLLFFSLLQPLDAQQSRSQNHHGRTNCKAHQARPQA